VSPSLDSAGGCATAVEFALEMQEMTSGFSNVSIMVDKTGGQVLQCQDGICIVFSSQDHLLYGVHINHVPESFVALCVSDERVSIPKTCYIVIFNFGVSSLN
jgi:hypothetical protein